VVPQQRILITGGTGFVGSHLAEELTHNGHTVTALGRGDGDLAQAGVAESLLRTRVPDVVVHLAALVGRVVGEEDPAETMRQNVDVTALVAAACATHGARLLHGSTTEVYGPIGDRIVNEDTPLDTAPDSTYGQSKRASEEAALRFVPDATLLRLKWPYGPGTAPGRARGAIVNMLDQAVRGVAIRVYRGDERSWCWVGDVARAIALLIERDERGAWNIGRDDRRCSMLEVAQQVCRVTGASEDLIDEVDAPTAPASGHASTAKLRATGWQPEVDFEDGLRRTLVSMAPR
jgi:dTDP-4-dehydrorhamnose reductase/4-ketoreductase